MMPTPVSFEAKNLDSLAGLFKLLSDITRLRILELLVQGERNVTTLCGELELPQPTVSHHLGLLRTRNIIVNRRAGKQIFYGIDGNVRRPDGQTLEITADGYA